MKQLLRLLFVLFFVGKLKLANFSRYPSNSFCTTQFATYTDFAVHSWNTHRFATRYCHLLPLGKQNHNLDGFSIKQFVLPQEYGASVLCHDGPGLWRPNLQPQIGSLTK